MSDTNSSANRTPGLSASFRAGALYQEIDEGLRNLAETRGGRAIAHELFCHTEGATLYVGAPARSSGGVDFGRDALQVEFQTSGSPAVRILQWAASEQAQAASASATILRLDSNYAAFSVEPFAATHRTAAAVLQEVTKSEVVTALRAAASAGRSADRDMRPSA